MKHIIIIGGGAAGMAAALTASKQREVSVTLLEGLDRVGKKILATGNGHCNLTNENMTPDFYHTQRPDLLADFLREMPTTRTVDFFGDLGLRCMTDEAGRVYPYCRQATMVLDVLLLHLQRQSNIRIVTGCKVCSVTQKGKTFVVKCENGETIRGDSVILTTGGQAAPKQGSDGSGYALAQGLGHHCTPLRPALVAFQCKGSFLKSLKGIRVLCETTLYQGKKRLGAERGELQFTDYGVSGIPAMQLSHRWKGTCEVSVDFFPDDTYDGLKQELRRRVAAFPNEPLENALLGLLHKRVQFALLKGLSIDPTAPAKKLGRGEMEQIVSAFKGWRFPVTGTLGWEQAQVTSGGIPLNEIRPDFSSTVCPGLYLAGEVLDVAGDCGGYNLHWAWCSGIAAGESAVEPIWPRRGR